MMTVKTLGLVLISFVAGLAGGFSAIYLSSGIHFKSSAVPVSNVGVVKAQKAQDLPYISLCKGEVKNCEAAPLEEGGQIGCLLARSDLSTACSNSLESFRNHLRPCHDEAAKYCPGVSVAKAQLIKCLRYYRSKISNSSCLDLL